MLIRVFGLCLCLIGLMNVSFAEPIDIWLANALRLQREIDINAPLKEATFIGTHNSYNSKAYQILFFRYIDPNQILSIKDQLDAGVRSIELDLHWSFANRFTKEILLCHGYSSHLGCSMFDRPFTSGLAELRDWLADHPNELVLLYLERHLDGHEPRMAAQLESYVGKFIYKTTQIRKHDSNPCVALPSLLTKADVLKAGKQLLVVTKYCDSRSSYPEENVFRQVWTDDVFTGIGEIKNNPFNFIDARIPDYQGYPACTIKDVFKNDEKHTSLWRIYEDRTIKSNLKKALKKILVKDMHELLHCGVNWPAMDMLQKNDKRLSIAIWSWARGYPKKAGGQCAVYVLNQGIVNLSCDHPLAAYVCREEHSRALKVISFSGTWHEGETACQTIAGQTWHFSLPLNATQVNQIKSIMPVNLTEVWLNYAVNSEGQWQPDVSRG